eukprot:8058556-Lingulodinium_polyedra.AAC.1
MSCTAAAAAAPRSFSSSAACSWSLSRTTTLARVRWSRRRCVLEQGSASGATLSGPGPDPPAGRPTERPTTWPAVRPMARPLTCPGRPRAPAGRRPPPRLSLIHI